MKSPLSAETLAAPLRRIRTEFDLPAHLTAYRNVARAARKAPPAGAEFLHQKLRAVRRGQLDVVLGTGVILVAGTGLAILVVEMFFDWLFDLPWAARAGVFLTATGILGWLAWRYVAKPYLLQPGEDATALAIERALPIFRGRFITSIQLARAGGMPPGGAGALARALIAQTTVLAGSLHFRGVVKTDKLRREAKLLALLVGVSLLGAWLAGFGATDALVERAFLFNVALPTKTQILVISGDRVVAIGEDVEIGASVAGFIPAAGEMQIAYASGQIQVFPMTADPAHRARFSRRIQSVQEPFQYQVRLGDALSNTFQVTTRPRPTVTALQCTQVYPAYTKLGTVRRSLGDLSLLAGSVLQIQATPSTALREATVVVAGDGRRLPMRVNPPGAGNGNAPGPRVMSAALPIRRGVEGFSIHLVDAEGIASVNEALYRIDPVPDQPPTVRVTYPSQEEELITAEAKTLVAFEASDDFAIGRVVLHYQITHGGAPVAAQSVELSLDGQTPKSLKRRYEWSVNGLRPKPVAGDVIEYWIEAVDLNDVTGPGVGLSERRQARVVTPEEKMAELMNRTNDALVGLDETVQHEEDLTKNLGSLIFEQPGAKP